MSEIMRKCPEGYREMTFKELQDFMNQAIVSAQLQGRLQKLQIEQVASEAVIRSTKAEIKSTLSEINVHNQMIRATNDALKVDDSKRGDILIGDGYVYICVDKDKRVESLPR